MSKSTPADLARAIELLHDYTGGTFTLYKTGDLTYGENWEATFTVGYGRHEHSAEAADPASAILKAAATIHGSPTNPVQSP